MNETPPLSRQFLSQLEEAYSKQDILSDPADCWAYGYDNSRRHTLPQAVVFPSTQKQIESTVQACCRFDIPVTTRGRGTGTTGASVPLRSGLVLSTERMKRVIEFSPANRYITVEPGMTNQEVQEIAGKHGFFWPPDPTSAPYCSVGGNLACNAAGPKAIKYGTPRENTLGLKAVTGLGNEIRTGVFTTKGVVGYDLTRLLLGSEGTLAIITEATLKLTPVPEAKKTFRAVYHSVQDAASAISSIMSQPVIPCVLEFIDGNAIDIVRKYSEVDLPKQSGAMLMIEVDGPKAGLDHAVNQVAEAAKNQGLLDLSIAKTDAEIDTLWLARKALAPSLRKVAPKKINEDVVVPVTEMPALIGGLNALSDRYQLPIINFGHAGNGNIHVNLLLDPEKPGEIDKAQRCLDDIFSLVLELKGTLSGEHGVGIEKRSFIQREIDANTLQLMRKIKDQFDPKGILNPGKIFPPV